MNEIFPVSREGQIPFVKMQGLQNHFVFVDARKSPFRPSTEEIQKICDVTRGIGGEELIVFEEPGNPNEGFFMRIYNSDGKEAEACINATRCAAKIFFDEQKVNEVNIRTLAGVLPCKQTEEGEIQIEVGEPKDHWAEIPLSRDMETLNLGFEQGELKGGTAINFGNPHVVFFVEDLDSVDLMEDAYPIFEDKLFPNQTNVEVAKLNTSSLIEMKVLERPGMITSACGSGACATYIAAKRNGLTNAESVTVRMPAGEVRVDDIDGKVFLTGPAEYCFSGYYPVSENPE